MVYPLNEFYSRIVKHYDRINRLFTLGMDQLWRRYTARTCLLYNPAEILDLCCGTGDLTIILARGSKKSIPVTGLDFNIRMLEAARRKSAKGNCRDVHFVHGDASNMPFSDDSFDSITIGFGFRNLTYENPHQSLYLSEIYRVLKRGGRLFILESGVPENPIVRLLFKGYLYLLVIPIGFFISGDNQAYRYLVRSSAGFFSADEINQILYKRGIVITERKRFFLGAANLFTAVKL
ncbi:MAG: ubiquinone/menaquinone biosynthesis methyltransferase [Bacteroidales bacterium]|nr:ubiquinone/menaquinone biosynthesis methyltransferase [Bacteroidales bacterium]